MSYWMHNKYILNFIRPRRAKCCVHKQVYNIKLRLILNLFHKKEDFGFQTQRHLTAAPCFYPRPRMSFPPPQYSACGASRYCSCVTFCSCFCTKLFEFKPLILLVYTLCLIIIVQEYNSSSLHVSATVQVVFHPPLTIIRLSSLPPTWSSIQEKGNIFYKFNFTFGNLWLHLFQFFYSSVLYICLILFIFRYID